MVLVSSVLHVMYVNIVTPATIVVVVFGGVLLWCFVVSAHSGLWDFGLCSIVVLVLGNVMWVKENSVDMLQGVHDCNAGMALGVSVLLLVVSECALFGTILWVVVLFLLACSGSTYFGNILQHHHLGWGVTSSGLVFQNALTLANSDLLFTTGMLALVVVHSMAGSLLCCAEAGCGVVVVLGSVFLEVQVCEYGHLYWCFFSSSSAMMFYVVTGLHGSHVLIGVLLLMGLWMQTHWYWVFRGQDYSTVGGSLGVLLYWHFVDGVWVFVVLLVYYAMMVI
nr:cytochrome c oxidase subunit 3 [Namystynia karyoxenos]